MSKRNQKPKFDGEDEYLPLAETEEDKSSEEIIDGDIDPATKEIEPIELPTEINPPLKQPDFIKESEKDEGIRRNNVSYLEKVNKPEGGFFGELMLYCGRETGECQFRKYEKTNPQALLWSCIRCKDIGIQIKKPIPYESLGVSNVV